MTLLNVEALDCRYGLLQAVRSVSLRVEAGETVALIGANGAGKTTLLRAVAGAHRPHSGRVVFDGVDITRLPAHRRVALGIALAPVAYLLGVPWGDCRTVGGLLGTRTVLNELIAYGELGKVKSQLDPRSFTIATYALCGFANFSSIGIQLGGIGALAPDRRTDLARLGFRALLAGTLANFLSACIAGILL